MAGRGGKWTSRAPVAGGQGALALRLGIEGGAPARNNSKGEKTGEVFVYRFTRSAENPLHAVGAVAARARRALTWSGARHSNRGLLRPAVEDERRLPGPYPGGACARRLRRGRCGAAALRCAWRQQRVGEGCRCGGAGQARQARGAAMPQGGADQGDRARGQDAARQVDRVARSSGRRRVDRTFGQPAAAARSRHQVLHRTPGRQQDDALRKVVAAQ